MATDYSKRSGRRWGFSTGGFISGFTDGFSKQVSHGLIGGRDKKKPKEKLENTSDAGPPKDTMENTSGGGDMKEAFRRGGRVSKRSC